MISSDRETYRPETDPGLSGAGHLGTVISEARAYEAEQKRAEALAELDRAQDEEEVCQSQERFRRYFELGLIGMAITSLTKGIIDLNDEISQHPGVRAR